MFQVLATILRDNWEWRKQIMRLAVFDLVKKSRGAVLSWAWFLIKPAMYIFCFWFAIEVGLRAGNAGGGPDAPPYILWLSAGIIPWFFMKDMLGGGVNVLKRYSYLVNKVKFPLSGISTIFTTSAMLIELMLIVALFVIYFACGQQLNIYLLQVPLLLMMMYMFWNMASIMFSQLSAMSKDFANLMNALSTPFFWLSGVLFNVNNIDIGWVKTILDFNPITFFVTSFRAAFYDHTWFWENTSMCVGFAIVCLATLVVMAFVYSRLHEEVADVF